MPSVPLPEGVMGLAQVPNGSIQALNQTKRIGYMGMAAKAAGTRYRRSRLNRTRKSTNRKLASI